MKFIKCRTCGAKISEAERCELANYKRTIGGEQFIFCCARCADEYEKKMKTGQRKKA